MDINYVLNLNCSCAYSVFYCLAPQIYISSSYHKEASIEILKESLKLQWGISSAIQGKVMCSWLCNESFLDLIGAPAYVSQEALAEHKIVKQDSRLCWESWGWMGRQWLMNSLLIKMEVSCVSTCLKTIFFHLEIKSWYQVARDMWLLFSEQKVGYLWFCHLKLIILGTD